MFALMFQVIKIKNYLNLVFSILVREIGTLLEAFRSEDEGERMKGNG